MPAFALLIAVALSAFTAPKQEGKRTDDRFWYQFNGGSVNQPGDYEIIGDGTEDPGCNSGSVRCAVLALPNPGHADQPDLTDQGKTIRNKPQ